MSNKHCWWAKEKRECIRCSSLYTPNKKLQRFCSHHCAMLGNKKRQGISLSLESRKKLSERFKGENGSGWRGGVSGPNERIRKSYEYRLWREAVFKRDDWTCVVCKKRGNRIHADHIKRFSLFPELRFSLDNGRTLCVPCHLTTETYGNVKK